MSMKGGRSYAKLEASVKDEIEGLDSADKREEKDEEKNKGITYIL